MRVELNYENIYQIILELEKYFEEVMIMKNVIIQTKGKIASSNSGQAIDSLIENLDDNAKDYAVVLDFVDELIRNTKQYFNDIEGCVRPINESTNIVFDERNVFNQIQKIEKDTLGHGTVFNGGLYNVMDSLSDVPYSECFESDDVLKFQTNEWIMRDLRNMLESGQQVLKEDILNMKKNHSSLKELEELDEYYARRLVNIPSKEYEKLDYEKPVSGDIEINIDYEGMGLDLTPEERAEVEKEISDNVYELAYLGWSKEEIEAYLGTLISGDIGDGSYASYLKSVRNKNKESQTVGSDVFNSMLDAGGSSSDKKLEIVKTYYDLGLPQSKHLSDPSNQYYDLINGIVQTSSVFGNIEDTPSDMQYFVHTTLRKSLNDNVIGGYPTGQDGLETMFLDGWIIPGAPDPAQILHYSRYHQLGDEFTLSDGRVYNPKYNIKVVSENKKFERIYNTELGMFLDEIVTDRNYKKDLTKAGVGVVTNAETYNYGYPDEHTKYDVNPYNEWGTDYRDDYEKDDDDLKKSNLEENYNNGYKDYIEENSDTSYVNMQKEANDVVDIYNKATEYYGEPGLPNDRDNGTIV